MSEDRSSSDGYSVPEDGKIPSPHVPPYAPKEKINENDGRYLSTTIMFIGALASLVLFTYLGPIVPVLVLPVLYLMCRNVIKVKPNLFSTIVAGLVFAFGLVYLIGFIVTNI